ncbi:MAG: energy transducer TonB [Deltaproteobacteria bacterium]|nr:energy transducer TonB [Deltaproteobacteria bacterium]
MIPKKIFLAAIILSLAVHIVLLALSGFLGGYDGTDEEEVFTVSLEKHLNKTGETPDSKKNALRDSPENIRKSTGSGAVDTIALDSTDTRYYPYLLQVKKNIDRRWSYPDDAFTRGEGGTTVVEFSIVKKGILTDSRVIVSSGHELLDVESLHAIRSAAPFASFPAEFGLAKLNIVAKFRYTLGD